MIDADGKLIVKKKSPPAAPNERRDKIVAQNPIVEYLRARGYELHESGDNFVTGACPIEFHKKLGHRPVSIDVQKQVWYCNDHKVGGSVIDWYALEQHIDIGAAMNALQREPDPTSKQFVCAYDYTDEKGNLIFQKLRFKVPPPKLKTFELRQPTGRGTWVHNLKGARRVLYHLPEIIAADQVLSLEGEKDADNVAKFGFTTTTNFEGAGKWRPEYSEALKGKDVILIGDNDADGRAHVAKVMRELAYVAREIRHAKVPEPFKDVSEYLASMPAEDGRSAIEKLIAGAEDAPELVSPLCDAVKYLNGEMPALPSEIIYHVMHEGSKMIVGGTSKGRKTMALLDANLSVSTGTPWWGFHTKKGPICYINFEIQDGFFWYRVKQICDAKQIMPEPGMFYAWNLRGRAQAIENLLEEILRTLKRKRFVLVTIDPVYKALGGRDENKAGDVAAMLNEIEKIAVQTGAAVAFGAHYSKGNQSMKDSIDRIGGSGVFARDPDTILTMTAHEKEECFTVDATLRNFPPLAPFVLKWDWPCFHREDEEDPNNLKQARGAKNQFVPIYKKETILDQLSIQTGSKITPLRKLLEERTGMSRATFYRLMNELTAEGVIREDEGELFTVSVLD